MSFMQCCDKAVIAMCLDCKWPTVGPELLEALEKLINIAETDYCRSKCEFRKWDKVGELAEARVAIRKARGGE